MPGSQYQNQHKVRNRRAGDFPGLPGLEEGDRIDQKSYDILLLEKLSSRIKHQPKMPAQDSVGAFLRVMSIGRKREQAHRALDGLAPSIS